MKTALLLLALLLPQAAQLRQPAAPTVTNPADNGTVEGTTILWASQSRPLENVLVYLRKGAVENLQEAQRRGISVSDASPNF